MWPAPLHLHHALPQNNISPCALHANGPVHTQHCRYCRRAALKRMTRDIKEDADEERRTMGQKSDGMDNVFLGNDRYALRRSFAMIPVSTSSMEPPLRCLDVWRLPPCTASGAKHGTARTNVRTQRNHPLDVRNVIACRTAL